VSFLMVSSEHPFCLSNLRVSGSPRSTFFAKPTEGIPEAWNPAGNKTSYPVIRLYRAMTSQ